MRYSVFSIKGILVEPPGYWKSEKGSEVCKFRIRDSKGEVWQIVSFRQIASVAKDLVEGVNLLVQGKNDAGQLIADYLELVTEKQKVGSSHAIRDWGSEEKLKEAIKEGRRRRMEIGLVRVTTGGIPRWIPRGYALELEDGTWYPRIEYLCDVYGANKISEVLKEEFKSIDLTSRLSKTFSQKYHALCERLISEIEQ